MPSAALQEVDFPVWWQIPLHAWSFERASLARRKELVDTKEVRFLSLTGLGPHFFSPTVELGNHAIHIEALKGPAQTRVQLFQNENPVADPVDLYAAKTERNGRVFLGRLDLVEGANNLTFKLVGKNDKSSGLGLDLIQIGCVHEK